MLSDFAPGSGPPTERAHKRRVKQLQVGQRIRVTDAKGEDHGTITRIDPSGDNCDVTWDDDGHTNTLSGSRASPLQRARKKPYRRLAWHHPSTSCDLFWKDDSLYRLGSKRALLGIVPDDKYPDIMWRVADGSLSSMANRTRAKDAGMAMALQGLNGRMSRPFLSGMCRVTDLTGSSAAQFSSPRSRLPRIRKDGLTPNCLGNLIAESTEGVRAWPRKR